MSGGGSYASIGRTVLAGTEERFDIPGTFLRCLSASHSDFEVRFEGAAPEYFDQGLKYLAADDETFTYVSVINNGVDLDIVFGYGFGDLDDDRLSLLGGALPTKPTAANPAYAVKPEEANEPFNVTPREATVVKSFETLVAVGAWASSALGLGLDSTRKRVFIQNRGTGDLMIVAGGYSGRLVLKPDEIFEYEGGGAVSVVNGNNFTVRAASMLEVWA